MRTKITTLFFAAFLSLALTAQTSGGPDAYGYTWKNSNHGVTPPTYNWVDIVGRGTMVTGLGDDNFVGPFPISAAFQFYWYPTPQFWIGSNGYISFKPQNISSAFPASIPLADSKDDWMAPFMADLNFAGATNPGKCYYFSNADSLVVSFIDVPLWVNATPDFTGSNSFQVILSALDTSITFNYLSMNQGTWVTIDALVGIENNTGTLGLSSLIDVLPPSTHTIKYYYPAVVTYAVKDGGIAWSGTENSYGVFVKSQGSATSLSSNVRNFGNQLLTSISVTDSVKNSSGVVVSSGSAVVPSLGALQDTTITFSNTFTAPAAGTYTHTNNVTGISGDLVASNDYRYQEIIAVDTNDALPGSLNPMTLDYSAGVAAGGTWSWTGGMGGIGVYIEPPIYPIRIESSQFHIAADPSAVGFHAMIYDDDGVNGGPGTLLDSVYVPTTSITLNAITTVPTSKNVDISEGGVYLLWQMNGNSVALSRATTLPISRRTYEVLGNSWSGFRDKETVDFVMGINVRYAPPTAAFEIDSTDSPQLIFTDLSAGIPDTWEWDFGDGSPISNLQNPTYAYFDTGYYNVCLKVTNLAGSDSTCQSIYIENVLPMADFTFNDLAAPVVGFTDLSTGVLINSWYWDFDDAGDDTSNLQNPFFEFTINAVHNVCMTVANHAGNSAVCKNVTITNVGINEVSGETKLLVYPNPFNERTRIEVQSSDLLTVTSLKLYDAVGKQIPADYTIDGNVIDLVGSDLNAGTYIFEVYGNNTRIARGRLMVK